MSTSTTRLQCDACGAIGEPTEGWTVIVTAHVEVRSSSEQYGAERWLDFNMAYDYTWGDAWVYPQVRRDRAGQ